MNAKRRGFDPVGGTVTLRGQVTDHGSAQPVTIELSGLTAVKWRGVPKDPKGFFEPSTVDIKAPDDRNAWRLRFEPWDSAELEFKCQTVSLNGEEVVGLGAWYQDSLDGPIPV